MFFFCELTNSCGFFVRNLRFEVSVPLRYESVSGANDLFPRRGLGWDCHTGQRLAPLACPVLITCALSALVITRKKRKKK